MLRTLPHHILWLALLFLIFAGRLLAQTVPSWPSSEHEDSTPSLVVLRNGEVLQGRVTSARERVLVILPGREISLRKGEVDVVARTLEEAYLVKRSKTPPTDVDARLDLAAWCMRHNLWAAARVELSAAGQVQESSPRRIALERRLQKAIAGDTAPHQAIGQSPLEPNPVTAAILPPAASKRPTHPDVKQVRYSWPSIASVPPSAKVSATKKTERAPRNATRGAATESPAALERFIQSLPSGAVEQFTSSLHPLITRSCATAGCHAPGNTTQFTLLRLPHSSAASRRLTQRNLYNTVQLVDFDRPEESRLLKIASQPHGPLPAGVFGDARSPKYQEMVAWISRLTGVPLELRDGSNNHKIANLDWDRAQNLADRLGPLTQSGDIASAADELQPNRPAEIINKSAEQSAVISTRSDRTPRRSTPGKPPSGPNLD
ncbi:MAG: hypothetical protein WD894_12635 [Pirellulales bacterium]